MGDLEPIEVEARRRAEEEPGPTYSDGWPRYHRHFADWAVHRDDECTSLASRRRVYVFDDDAMAEHERWVAERPLQGMKLPGSGSE